MALDPNIALGVRPLEVPNQLAQYAQLSQLQNVQNQNRMADMQLQEYERARGEEEGLRNYLTNTDFTKPENRIGLFKFGKTGREYVKTLAEQDTAALTAKNVQSQIDEREFGLRKKKLDFAWSSIGSAPTPQEAILKINQGAKDGIFDMKSATSEIQQLQNMTPEQYQQYRVQKVMGILDAKDKLGFMLPKTRDRDTGGVIQVIQDNPALPGYGLPIAGGAISKTPTFADITSQGQLNVARQRLAQEAQGVTYQQDAQGNIIALPSRLTSGAVPVARPVTGEGGAPIKGKPSAFAEKTAAQKAQLQKDLATGIRELEDVTKDGGLIDQSTGSGAGRLVDVGARFVGKAMPGDIAIGKLKPIADLPLKLVPRFEGPQSNADTTSYKEAAAQLADPTLPTKIRKEAGKTVLRLMQERKNQFATSDMAAEGAGGGGGVDTSNPLLK
jgi:hypothetical protein